MYGSREEKDQRIKRNQRKFDDQPRNAKTHTRAKADKPRRGNEADFNEKDFESND